MTRFPNVRCFDVADFDVFQHSACAFDLKVLHPQRELKCPPSCENKVITSISLMVLDNVQIQSGACSSTDLDLGVLGFLGI